MMMEQTPTWQCPVCNKSLEVKDIYIDMFVFFPLVFIISVFPLTTNDSPTGTLTPFSRNVHPQSKLSLSDWMELGDPMTTNLVQAIK